MKLINLTPQTIVFPNGAYLESQGVAHCVFRTQVRVINGAQFLRPEPVQEVFSLPEPEKDTIYFVRRTVRLALPERLDLASPQRINRQQNIVISFMMNGEKK